LSTASIDRAIASGQLKAKKYGKRSILLLSEVERFLRELPDQEPKNVRRKALCPPKNEGIRASNRCPPLDTGYLGHNRCRIAIFSFFSLFTPVYQTRIGLVAAKGIEVIEVTGAERDRLLALEEGHFAELKAIQV